MNENTKAPKRIKKPNFLVRLLALCATGLLLLGALLAVVYRDQLNLDAILRRISYRSMQTSDTGEAAPFTHAGGSKLDLAYLEGGIVTASAAGAHYYDWNGGLLAEQVLSLENPVLEASRSTGVVYDAGGQSLFAFRGSEEVFSLTLTGSADLLSVRPNDSGWLAVTAQQSGFKGAVTVYNSRGSEVIQISLSTTFAVDAAVSPDCKTVAAVTIGQENGVFFSRLLLYPVNQTEPSAQIDLGSLTVLDLDYEDDLIWVLGEDRLLMVNPQDASVQSYTFSPSYLKGCSLGGDGFALLLTGRYRSGGATRATVVHGGDQTVRNIELTGQVLDCAAAGPYCALLTGAHLTIYDQELNQYAFLADAQSARQLDLSPNGSALLANDQQAWLYIPQ